MRFAPKTEEEIDTRVLLPAGEYPATVMQATDEVSKEKRNEQIHLVLRVEDDLGNRNAVHDYLLEAMAGKLRHFCESAGLMDEYQSGDLSASHCSGQDVRVKLAIEHDKSGRYPDKNVVKDYIVANGHGTAKQTPAVKPAIAAPVPASDSPKLQAWRAWLSAWSRFLNEFPAEAGKRDATWQTCFSDFFPNQEPSQVTDREWERFRLAVPKWDPINGWSKAKVPPASPISKESVFDEADIPF